MKSLKDFRMEIEEQDAMSKLAFLDEVYADDELRTELFTEIFTNIQEKVASGDMEEISGSTIVSMSARLTEDAIAELEAEASEEEAEKNASDEEYEEAEKTAAGEQIIDSLTDEELEDLCDDVEEALKIAGVDVNEVIESDDDAIISEAADLAAYIISEAYGQ